jgi:predicted metal-binding membrane protein
MTASTLEGLLRRDGLIVLAALGLLTLLGWIALLAGAGSGMDPLGMSGWRLPLDLPPALSAAWTPLYWLLAFSMWVVMMVAMMLPSAAPTALLYARVVRQAEKDGSSVKASASVASFTSAYVAVWSLFSLLAVGLQWALEHAGAMSAMMSSRIALLSGGLLIAAGLYQLTPLKSVCLRHCRSPAHVIAHHWRPGVLGAWRMGFSHGLHCLGCCAALMLLLFVGGVMNLVWIAALTLIVAVEKLAPFGEATAKLVAAILIAGGVALVADSL